MDSMIRTAQHRRHFVQCLIRGIVALFLGGSTVFVMVHGLLGQIPYGVESLMQRPFFTMRDELIWGAAGAMTGTIAWLLQGRLARWIVPMPRHECPHSGYGLHRLTAAICPECGGTLSSQCERASTPLA